MDLAAGHYTVHRGTPSPLRQAGIDALSVSIMCQLVNWNYYVHLGLSIFLTKCISYPIQ
jgi:hypothetical protein